MARKQITIRVDVEIMQAVADELELQRAEIRMANRSTKITEGDVYRDLMMRGISDKRAERAKQNV